MRAGKANRGRRPVRSYEFGTVLLFGLFGVPLVMHLLASLSI